MSPLKCIVLLILLCCTAGKIPAQQSNQILGLARQFVASGAYEKAVPLLKQLYDEAPFDKNRYDEYLDALLLAQQFETAHELVQYMTKIRRTDPVMEVDRARVFEQEGKSKEAKEHYQAALSQFPADELVTKRLANAFEQLGQIEFAIEAYEQARQQWQNPYIYATELSLLYAKNGNTEKAMNALLDVAMSQSSALEQVKSSLLNLLGDGGKKTMTLFQKTLQKRLTQVPDNPALNELNSWIYITNGNYEGALKQIIALDKKLEESGQRVLNFGKQAALDKHDDIALQAYNYLLNNGPGHPLYTQASEAQIALWRRQLDKTRPVNQQMVSKLVRAYQDLLALHPQYYSQPLIRDYGSLLALYENQPDSAIALLAEAIDAPTMPKDLAGYIKLDMGDYQVVAGRVWEASLLYSQVDKDFKEDLLGEEARFKNAKLAYYRGDFEWAQAQLSVLKASTSELIANDALYLSVLITENSDTNQLSLLRFAAADLLLFQHQTKASDLLLDSLSKAYPSSPLQDDILMLRASIAAQEGRFQEAIAFWTQLTEQHGDDVLADDATFKLALLYDEQLQDNQQAIKYYEAIVLKYPGSTYVQTARLRLAKLSSDKLSEPVNP